MLLSLVASLTDFRANYRGNTRVFLLIALAIVQGPAGDAPAMPVPAPWVAFEPAASETDYRAAMAGITPEVERIRSQPRLRPAFGFLIGEVTPKSQADNAGVRKGDFITHIDGVQLPDEESFDWCRRTKTQVISICSPALGDRNITINKGRFGILFNADWDPLAGYLAHPALGAGWEMHLQVAAQAARFGHSSSRLDIAQQGLMAAQQMGCNHPTWYVIAAIVSARTGRFEDALRFSELALPRVSENERLPLAGLRFQAALASGDPATALAVDRAYEVMTYSGDRAQRRTSLEAATKAFALVRARGAVLSWNDLRKADARDVIFDRQLQYLGAQQQSLAEVLRDLDPDGTLLLQGKDNTDALNRDGVLKFAQQRGRFDITRVGPVLRDVDCAMTAGLVHPGVVHNRGYFQLALANHAERESPLLIKVRVNEDRIIEVEMENMLRYSIRLPQINVFKGAVRVELYVRGSAAGIMVDGIPVYHGPTTLDPVKRQLGLDIHTRDATGSWSLPRWRGALADQKLALPPIEVKRPEVPKPGANDF